MWRMFGAADAIGAQVGLADFGIGTKNHFNRSGQVDTEIEIADFTSRMIFDVLQRDGDLR